MDYSSDVLAAKQAIADMLFRYCRGLDRMDKPLANSVFHPQSEVDYDNIFRGTGHGFIDWVWGQHAAMVRHSHNITNLYVEPLPEKAASEAYVMVVLRNETPQGVTVTRASGRYLDEWVRDGKLWLIRKRKYVHEFLDTQPVTDDTTSDSKTTSRRDRTDPSYGLAPPLTFN